MALNKVQIEAIELIIRRVSKQGAFFTASQQQWDASPPFCGERDVTKLIQESMRLHDGDTLAILDALKSGDTHSLRMLIRP